jgi:DNA-binding NtrC family response regulator
MEMKNQSAAEPGGSTPIGPHGSGANREGMSLVRATSGIDEEEFRRFLVYAANFENGESLSLRPWLQIAETWRITQALHRCRGNRSAAARALGIGRRTLYAKMEKLGITASWGL